MSPPSAPLVSACRVEGNRAELALQFPPGLGYFEGHFPGFPVLPAVAQVEIAIRFARELLDVRGAFQSLKHVKFRKPILPGESIGLSLEWDAPAARLAFAFACGGAPVSSGTIGFVA